MKIAIGGSAANPPHLGHLMVLNYMMSQKQFDQIIWIPSGSSDEKLLSDIHPDHRVAMTELLIPKEWRLRTPKLTIRYTDVYGTNLPSFYHLENLQKEYPDAELTWYTGSDSDVSCWDRGRELLELWKVFVIPRKGHCSFTQLHDAIDIPDISSTEIKERIRTEEPFSHLTTPEVAEYIENNGLYKRKPE